MRLKLWLKRIKRFKIRGLHRRRSKNMHRGKSMKANPTFYMSKSPVFVSGNLSLPTSQKENPCLSPVMNQKAPYHVHQRMFTLSPLSPLASPALTSTPTGHNTPLALKDLLGFEAVDRNRNPNTANCSKKPNTFAHIAASFRCCTAESPATDSSSNGTHKVFADNGQQNHLKDHKDQGSLHASKATKWTGICKCMLVHVEKQIVTTHADVRTKPRGMRHGASTHTKQRNAMRNGLVKGTNSMQASESSASIDRENALSMSREKVNVCRKLPTTASLDRGKLAAGEHASVSALPSQCPGIHSTSAQLDARSALPTSLAHEKKFDDRRKPIRKPPLVRDSTTSAQSCPISCTLPKEQLSLAKSESFFADKGGPSAPSSVSSMDKIHKWGGSHDAKNAQRCTPSVHKWRTHQEQASQSSRVASDMVDVAVDGNKVGGLGSDEESSLLQADSYESSETFSISSHSPWLNEPKKVASSTALDDLEAHSRPWISMEKHASIAKLECKSALNHEKSRRADAKAIRRSYQKEFTSQKPVSAHHHSKSDTIVLPSGMSNANQELNPSSTHACHADKGLREAVKGSLAVEKRSRNPYVDFTDSMLDMILQNHMCSSKELEGLLQCFLSLNSLEHHDVIVQAFTEVWEKVVVGKTA